MNQRELFNNITVSKLDEDDQPEMRLNLTESIPSEFNSISSFTNTPNKSNEGQAMELSPRSFHSRNSDDICYLSVNRNTEAFAVSDSHSQDGNAYCTPESRDERQSVSTGSNPKFVRFGVKAPRKGAAYIDSAGSSQCSARK